MISSIFFWALEPLKVFSGNPPCPPDFVGGEPLGPQGSINCFGIHAEKVCYFGHTQEFVWKSWFKLEAVIARIRFVMSNFPSPYVVRNTFRKCITRSGFYAVKIIADVAKWCGVLHRLDYPQLQGNYQLVRNLLLSTIQNDHGSWIPKLSDTI